MLFNALLFSIIKSATDNCSVAFYGKEWLQPMRNISREFEVIQSGVLQNSVYIFKGKIHPSNEKWTVKVVIEGTNLKSNI